MISYIEKIFCERCAFSLIVEPEYEEAGESKIRKNSEIRIMQEAAHVIEQSSFGHVKDEAEEGTESEANQPDTTKEEKKEFYETEAKNSGAKKTKKKNRRNHKRKKKIQKKKDLRKTPNTDVV